MSAARAFLPLTLVLFVTLGCTSDRVIAPQDRGKPSPRSAKRSERIIPAFEVQRRLAIVYFQLELHWVMRGKYPKSLRELVIQSPSFPFPTLKADLIVDPYSAYRLPLRYRVTDNGPELASIGPDRRWGGWPSERHVNFYSLDDVRLTRASLKGCFQRYMHATYFQAVANEKIPRVPTGTDYLSVKPKDPSDVNRFLRSRIAKTQISASHPRALADQMTRAFNMLGPPSRGDFVRPELAGYDCWPPRGPCLDRVSLYDAVGVLLESTPYWVQLTLLDEQSVLETDRSHGHIDHEELYSFYGLVPEELSASVTMLISYFPYEPHRITTVFPSGWLNDEQLDRLRTVLARFARDTAPQVGRTESGIALYWLDPYGMVFFFIDRFGDHVLDWATTLELHEEFPELDDAE